MAGKKGRSGRKKENKNMINIHSTIPENIDSIIKQIAKKNDWSKCKTVRHLVIQAVLNYSVGEK